MLYISLENVRYGVPSIRIMLGGGPDTIDFILAELKKENPLPVVIIRGSGKAADILSYAYRQVSEAAIPDCFRKALWKVPLESTINAFSCFDEVVDSGLKYTFIDQLLPDQRYHSAENWIKIEIDCKGSVKREFHHR